MEFVYKGVGYISLIHCRDNVLKELLVWINDAMIMILEYTSLYS